MKALNNNKYTKNQKAYDSVLREPLRNIVADNRVDISLIVAISAL